VLKNAQGNAEIAFDPTARVGWLSRDDFSTRKGHAGPFMETPGAQMPGQWIFDYSIIPHSTPGPPPSGRRMPLMLRSGRYPPVCMPGISPPPFPSWETIPETFIVSAVKPAGDGNAWLVRGYNITGKPISVTLKPWMPFKKVALVNLAEENQAALQPDQTGCVTFIVRAHQMSA